MNTETRSCQNCKNDFTIDAEDFAFYEKMGVQPLKTCRICSFKKQALWRNEISLYNDKSALSGKPLVTVYNPKNGFKVVSVDEYRSDEWDPLDFGREYDLSRPFFDQFSELFKDTYKRALHPVLSLGPNINSDYVNFAGACKNAFMCFNTAFVENVQYLKGSTNIKDSLDLYYCDGLENCYECINVQKSNKVFWAQNSSACVDCFLIEDCHNCQDCFGCVALRNKKYCWFNEQLDKEEYKKRLEGVKGSYKSMQEQTEAFKSHRLKYPKRYSQNINAINSTGNYLIDCNNCKECFEVGSSEDSRYVYAARKQKDTYCIVGGIQSEMCFNAMSPNACSNIIASVASENSNNIEYSFGLDNCSDCFGCDGLKNAQYCILNKEYSKEEYQKIRQHIVAELKQEGLYGSVFPAEFAPFAYNESVGFDNFPMSKDDVMTLGFKWEDDVQETKGKETVAFADLPDNISDVDDSILQEVLADKTNGRNYKINGQELAFYRRHNIPLPRESFFTRFQKRINKRGVYQFWDRPCDNCEQIMVTNYSPDRPEIVYCESCYQKEVL